MEPPTLIRFQSRGGGVRVGGQQEAGETKRVGDKFVNVDKRRVRGVDLPERRDILSDAFGAEGGNSSTRRGAWVMCTRMRKVGQGP